MGNSKQSKGNSGIQRRLFERRGIRKKVYKNICKVLREMNVNESDIDLVISAVQAGELQLGNADLEYEIISLGKIDKDIQRLERKLNSNAGPVNESGMSM